VAALLSRAFGFPLRAPTPHQNAGSDLVRRAMPTIMSWLGSGQALGITVTARSHEFRLRR